MLGARYKSKKALKESIDQPLRFVETSFFGCEYKDTGVFTVVGPDPYTARNYFAQVTMKNGLIVKVK